MEGGTAAPRVLTPARVVVVKHRSAKKSASRPARVLNVKRTPAKDALGLSAGTREGPCASRVLAELSTNSPRVNLRKRDDGELNTAGKETSWTECKPPAGRVEGGGWDFDALFRQASSDLQRLASAGQARSDIPAGPSRADGSNADGLKIPQKRKSSFLDDDAIKKKRYAMQRQSALLQAADRAFRTSLSTSRSAGPSASFATHAQLSDTSQAVRCTNTDDSAHVVSDNFASRKEEVMRSSRVFERLGTQPEEPDIPPSMPLATYATTAKVLRCTPQQKGKKDGGTPLARVLHCTPSRRGAGIKSVAASGRPAGSGGTNMLIRQAAGFDDPDRVPVPSSGTSKVAVLAGVEKGDAQKPDCEEHIGAMTAGQPATSATAMLKCLDVTPRVLQVRTPVGKYNHENIKGSSALPLISSLLGSWGGREAEGGRALEMSVKGSRAWREACTDPLARLSFNSDPLALSDTSGSTRGVSGQGADMDVLRNGVEAPSLGFANTEGAGGDTLSLSRSPRRRKTLLTLGLMGSYETNRHSLVSQLVESYLPVDPAPRLVAVAGKADATSITSPCSADYQPCLPPPLPPRPSPLAQTHGWRLSAGVQKRTNAESETCTSKIQQGAVQIQGLQVDSSRRRSSMWHSIAQEPGLAAQVGSADGEKREFCLHVERREGRRRRSSIFGPVLIQDVEGLQEPFSMRILRGSEDDECEAHLQAGTQQSAAVGTLTSLRSISDRALAPAKESGSGEDKKITGEGSAGDGPREDQRPTINDPLIRYEQSTRSESLKKTLLTDPEPLEPEVAAVAFVDTRMTSAFEMNGARGAAGVNKMSSKRRLTQEISECLQLFAQHDVRLRGAREATENTTLRSEGSNGIGFAGRVLGKGREVRSAVTPTARTPVKMFTYQELALGANEICLQERNHSSLASMVSPTCSMILPPSAKSSVAMHSLALESPALSCLGSVAVDVRGGASGVGPATPGGRGGRILDIAAVRSIASSAVSAIRRLQESDQAQDCESPSVARVVRMKKLLSDVKDRLSAGICGQEGEGRSTGAQERGEIQDENKTDQQEAARKKNQIVPKSLFEAQCRAAKGVACAEVGSGIEPGAATNKWWDAEAEKRMQHEQQVSIDRLQRRLQRLSNAAGAYAAAAEAAEDANGNTDAGRNACTKTPVKNQGSASRKAAQKKLSIVVPGVSNHGNVSVENGQEDECDEADMLTPLNSERYVMQKRIQEVIRHVGPALNKDTARRLLDRAQGDVRVAVAIARAAALPRTPRTKNAGLTSLEAGRRAATRADPKAATQDGTSRPVLALGLGAVGSAPKPKPSTQRAMIEQAAHNAVKKDQTSHTSSSIASGLVSRVSDACSQVTTEVLCKDATKACSSSGEKQALPMESTLLPQIPRPAAATESKSEVVKGEAKELTVFDILPIGRPSSSPPASSSDPCIALASSSLAIGNPSSDSRAKTNGHVTMSVDLRARIGRLLTPKKIAGLTRARQDSQEDLRAEYPFQHHLLESTCQPVEGIAGGQHNSHDQGSKPLPAPPNHQSPLRTTRPDVPQGVRDGSYPLRPHLLGRGGGHGRWDRREDNAGSAEPTPCSKAVLALAKEVQLQDLQILGEEVQEQEHRVANGEAGRVRRSAGGVDCKDSSANASQIMQGSEVTRIGSQDVVSERDLMLVLESRNVVTSDGEKHRTRAITAETEGSADELFQAIERMARTSPTLARLSPKDLTALLDGAQTLSLPAGHKLMRQPPHRGGCEIRAPLCGPAVSLLLAGSARAQYEGVSGYGISVLGTEHLRHILTPGEIISSEETLPTDASGAYGASTVMSVQLRWSLPSEITAVTPCRLLTFASARAAELLLPLVQEEIYGLAAAVQAQPLFASLSLHDIMHEVLTHAALRVLPEGTLLVAEGSTPSTTGGLMHLVLAGKVASSHALATRVPSLADNSHPSMATAGGAIAGQEHGGKGQDLRRARMVREQGVGAMVGVAGMVLMTPSRSEVRAVVSCLVLSVELSTVRHACFKNVDGVSHLERLAALKSAAAEGVRLDQELALLADKLLRHLVALRSELDALRPLLDALVGDQKSFYAVFSDPCQLLPARNLAVVFGCAPQLLQAVLDLEFELNKQLGTPVVQMDMETLVPCIFAILKQIASTYIPALASNTLRSVCEITWLRQNALTLAGAMDVHERNSGKSILDLLVAPLCFWPRLLSAVQGMEQDMQCSLAAITATDSRSSRNSAWLKKTLSLELALDMAATVTQCEEASRDVGGYLHTLDSLLHDSLLVPHAVTAIDGDVGDKEAEPKVDSHAVTPLLQCPMACVAPVNGPGVYTSATAGAHHRVLLRVVGQLLPSTARVNDVCAGLAVGVKCGVMILNDVLVVSLLDQENTHLGLDKACVQRALEGNGRWNWRSMLGPGCGWDGGSRDAKSQSDSSPTSTIFYLAQTLIFRVRGLSNHPCTLVIRTSDECSNSLVVKVQDEETMRGIMSLYASCIHQAQATAQAPYQDEPLDGAAVGDEQVQAHGIIDGTQTAHQ